MESRANYTVSRRIPQIKAMLFLARSQKMVPTSKVYVLFQLETVISKVCRVRLTSNHFFS